MYRYTNIYEYKMCMYNIYVYAPSVLALRSCFVRGGGWGEEVWNRKRRNHTKKNNGVPAAAIDGDWNPKMSRNAVTFRSHRTLVSQCPIPRPRYRQRRQPHTSGYQTARTIVGVNIFIFFIIILNKTATCSRWILK